MLFASFDAGLLGMGGAPSAIDVDVDLTFVVELVLFVGLTLVLTPLLFDPMLALIEERERRIDGAKAHARKIDERSATALAEYEAEMAKARALANADRDKARAQGLALNLVRLPVRLDVQKGWVLRRRLLPTRPRYDHLFSDPAVALSTKRAGEPFRTRTFCAAWRTN